MAASLSAVSFNTLPAASASVVFPECCVSSSAVPKWVYMRSNRVLVPYRLLSAAEVRAYKQAQPMSRAQQSRPEPARQLMTVSCPAHNRLLGRDERSDSDLLASPDGERPQPHESARAGPHCSQWVRHSSPARDDQGLLDVAVRLVSTSSGSLRAGRP